MKLSESERRETEERLRGYYHKIVFGLLESEEYDRPEEWLRFIESEGLRYATTFQKYGIMAAQQRYQNGNP